MNHLETIKFWDLFSDCGVDKELRVPEAAGGDSSVRQAALTAFADDAPRDPFQATANGTCSMSLDSLDSRAPRGFLAKTAIVALVMGIAGLGLAHHLARSLEHQKSRVASLPPGIVDPEVTGSIGTAARSIVLDPCVARERLIVRGP